MKKKIIATILSVLLVVSVFGQLVNAASTGTLIYQIVDCPGTMRIVERCVSTGQSDISQRFVYYISPSWGYKSQYVGTTSNSVSWSWSTTVTQDLADSVRASLGLSMTYSKTYSVAEYYPANSKKLSKLGFASDFHRQNFSFTRTVDGKLTNSSSGYIDTPTGTTYVLVYYK